jgi:uncharacterized protein YciI
VKYVVMYEGGPDTRERAPLHFADHRAHYLGFHERGLLLMVGPLVDGDGGAIGIFATREAAEEFVAGDPFVQNGVVAGWTIREWNEVLAP